MSSSSTTYAAQRRQQTWSNQHQLRKQRSFIESSSVANRILCQASDSSRGGHRSGSLILGRLPSERSKFSYLQKQRTVADSVCSDTRSRSEHRSRGFSLINSECGGGSVRRRICERDSSVRGVKLAWTTSGDTFDFNGHTTQAGSLFGNSKRECMRVFSHMSKECIASMSLVCPMNTICKSQLQNFPLTHLSTSSKSSRRKLFRSRPSVGSRNFIGDRSKKSSAGVSSKADSKINLSIVLSQTIKATECETATSDIDSSSEGAETGRSVPHFEKESPSVGNTKKKSPVQQGLRQTSAAQRRAQFQSTRPEHFNPSSDPQTIPSTSIPLRASPSLSISQRPPLVRAMSAPVRSLDDNNKNTFANNKRKTRRRKVITRNGSCDKVEQDSVGGAGKKVISRSKSTIGSDVITLVSLISSEGSDSEKEENTTGEENQTARAPLLRKTGKSDHDQPTFQMAIKDFPHMLRRSSIAPLAARLRSNRPPTAPPVSIFLADYENCTVKLSEMEKITNSEDFPNGVLGKENNKIFMKTASTEEISIDYNFPDYVRSLKERECWKLFQKMQQKGITVTYDTVLRGMLTPTEFRQLQRQRELESAKAKEAEEAELAANEENKIASLRKK